MITHELQALVICGHANGKISSYDFKNHKLVHQVQANTSIQSLCFLNNCLHIVAGLTDGSMKLYESSGQMNLISIVENAHQPKYGEAVNSISCLMNSEQSTRSNSNLPFFVSCGADSTLKIFEHNLYQMKKGEK